MADAELLRQIELANAARLEAHRLRKVLQQIADFAPPTCREYENAANVIRDIQYIALQAVTKQDVQS